VGLGGKKKTGENHITRRCIQLYRALAMVHDYAREEEAGDWRKPHNEETHSTLQSSGNGT